jgi:hypothetical protein
MKKLLTYIGMLTVTLSTGWSQSNPPVYLSGYSSMTIPGQEYMPGTGAWVNDWPGGTIDPNGTFTYEGTTTPGGMILQTTTYRNGDLTVVEVISVYGTRTHLRREGMNIFTSMGSLNEVLDGTIPWSIYNHNITGGYSFSGGSTGLTPPTEGNSSVYVEQAEELNAGLGFMGGVWVPQP